MVLFLFGFHWIKTKGKRAGSKKEAQVIIGNHISFVDPTILAMYYCPISVGAKESVSKPIAGWILKAMRTIIVERENKDNKRLVMDKIKMVASDMNANQVMMFPEGVCTTGETSLVSFKPGAFVTGKSIQPVCFK